jgi:cellobiose-specific phosphotransferase system component IIA
MARGSIRERQTKSETVFDVIISYNDASRKRKQIWKTAPSFRQAEKLKNQLLSEVDSGTFVKPSKLTVKAYLDQWMNSYVVPSLSSSTVDTYQLIIRKHIIPILGDIALANLQPLAIQNHYSEDT